jgi:hypothetical protein
MLAAMREFRFGRSQWAVADDLARKTACATIWRSIKNQESVADRDQSLERRSKQFCDTMQLLRTSESSWNGRVQIRIFPEGHRYRMQVPGVCYLTGSFFRARGVRFSRCYFQAILVPFFPCRIYFLSLAFDALA